MAKQVGPVYITGTIGWVTYYKLNGLYYARLKSSLSRRRVKSDRRFSNTMRNADWFAQASKISSAVFLSLRQSGFRNNSQRIDRKIQSRSVKLVRMGMDAEEIKKTLINEFERFIVPLLRKALSGEKVNTGETMSMDKESKTILFWRKLLSILNAASSP